MKMIPLRGDSKYYEQKKTAKTQSREGLKMSLDLDKETEGIASVIVDSALKVHRALGPGLLENVYEACLSHELRLRNLQVENQVIVPIEYEGLVVDAALRLDMLVANSVIIELKSVEKLIPLYDAQVLSYMKLTQKRLGFLINFNVPLIKDGIKRIVLS